MDDDDEREFVQTVLSNFSSMEGQLGQDGYRSMLQNQAAVQAMLQSKTQINKAIAATINVFGLVFIIAMLPVVVWLWKWAIEA